MMPGEVTGTRITTKAAAALLGMSEAAVLAKTKRGELPAVPVGTKKRLFSREALLAWRDAQLSRGLVGGPESSESVAPGEPPPGELRRVARWLLGQADRLGVGRRG